MVVMNRALAALVTLTALLASGVCAETLQERGLPSLVSFEAVFPQFAFGREDPFHLKSEIVVINPSDAVALFEFGLFHPTGESAFEIFEDCDNRGDLTCWRNPYDLKLSPENSVYYKTLPPHSVQRLAFPGQNSHLVERFFSGWLRLRSNHELMAYQVLTVTHIGSERVSTVDLTANYSATSVAESVVASARCNVFSGHPLFGDEVQIGWDTVTSAVALVNPGSEPLKVTLELEVPRNQLVKQTKTLELSPKTQQAQSVGELFPSFVPRNCGRSGYLRILSESSEPFAITMLQQKLRTYLDGQLRGSGKLPPLSWSAELAELRTPEPKPFDFPVEIVDELGLQDFRMILTRFGFVLEMGGQVVSTTRVNEGKELFASEEAGVAVVAGSKDTLPIVFLDTGKVVTAEMGSSGIAEFEDQSEDDQIRVRVGDRCLYTEVVLSKRTQEILEFQNNSSTPPPGCWVFSSAE